MDVNKTLERLSLSKFRSRFNLGEKEKNYVQTKGLETIQNHAYDFIQKRVAPASIPNDGKQSPMRGHPVFIAQHATATCCRGCIQKWHHIDRERDLTKEEIDDLVHLIMEWIRRKMGN